MNEEKLWTRAFIALMVVNFCGALAFYLIAVKVTEFAVDTYGVPQSMAALTMTAFVIAALLTRLFLGGRIDEWGVKRSLLIGTGVSAVAMALYLVPMGFVPLMVVRVAHGFGFALVSGCAAAGAALVIPPSRYGEGIGYFSMMQALATGIGPFVAILLTNLFGSYTAMFAAAAIASALALVCSVIVKIPASGGERGGGGGGGEPRHLRARGISSLVQLSVVPLGCVLFLVYFGYSGILSFVTSYADWRGLSDAVSLYFVVYALVILLTRPSVGRRIDRKGENSTIYFCFASYAVGLAVLALAVNGALLLASAALAGFGLGAIQSIVQAVIARDTPPDEMGKANSTFFMSMDLGTGVGPVVIGAVIPALGYSGVYLLLVALAVLAAVVYHLVHGRKRP